MMEGKLSCAVVRDLLPLYAEGLVSEETRAEVEVHLTGCAACQAEFERVQAAPPSVSQIDAAPIKQVKKRIRRRYKIAAAVSSLIVLLMAAVLVLNLWTIGFTGEEIAARLAVRPLEDGREGIVLYLSDMPYGAIFSHSWPDSYTYHPGDGLAEAEGTVDVTKTITFTTSIWQLLFSPRHDRTIAELSPTGEFLNLDSFSYVRDEKNGKYYVPRMERLVYGKDGKYYVPHMERLVYMDTDEVKTTIWSYKEWIDKQQLTE